MSLKAIFTVVVTFSLTTPSLAQTLFDAMVLAHNNESTLTVQRAQLNAESENIGLAKSKLWRPNISVTGTISHDRTRVRDKTILNTTALDQETTNRTIDQTYGYTIELPLLDFSALKNIEQTRLSLSVDSSKLIQAEQQLLQKVVESYASVLLNRGLVALYERSSQDLNLQLQENEQMAAAGRRTIGNIINIEAKIASTRVQLQNAIGGLEKANEDFRLLVGKFPDNLQSSPKFLNMPETLEAALLAAAALNPTMLAAKTQVKASKMAVASAVARLLPTLDLTHTFTHTRDKTAQFGDTATGQQLDTVDSQNEFNLALQLSMPLYAAGSTRAKIRQVKKQLASDQLALSVTQNSTFSETTTAWNRVNTNKETMVLHEESLLLAIEAENSSAFRLERAQIAIDDYLLTRTARVLAEENRLRAKYSMLTDSTKLLVAIGFLTADLLNLPIEK